MGFFAQVQVEFPLTAVHYNPWNVDTQLFCQRTARESSGMHGFVSLNSMGMHCQTYQKYIWSL